MDKTIETNEAIKTEQKQGGVVEISKHGNNNPDQKQFKKMTLHKKRELFHKLVTEEDFNEVVRKYVERAKKGEQSCMEYLLNQLIGKAPQSVIMDGNLQGNITIKWEE